MEKGKSKKIIWTTFAGVAGGALLGALFAPDKGAKTRKKLSKKSNEAFKEISKDVKELRQYMSKTTTKAKEGAEDISQKAKEKGKEMKDSATDMIESAEDLAENTKEELFEKAKEAQIDGYSTMDKSELVDALKKNLLPKKS